jgi:hypothetical protein
MALAIQLSRLGHGPQRTNAMQQAESTSRDRSVLREHISVNVPRQQRAQGAHLSQRPATTACLENTQRAREAHHPTSRDNSVLTGSTPQSSPATIRLTNVPLLHRLEACEIVYNMRRI